MPGRFLKNASLYTGASFFYVLASLISFPILTRVLEVEQYGMLGLVTATIPVLVGIGKFGLQHASIRFYSEIRSKQSSWTIEQYFSTLFISLVFSSLLMFLVWNGVVLAVGEQLFKSDLLCTLLLISSYIIVVRILESAMLNVLQAQEEALKHTIYKVVKRVVVLAATLTTLLFYRADLLPYFIVLSVVEVVVLLVFGFSFIPLGSIRLGHYRSQLVIAMMTFGVPMFGMELGAAIMNIADRYIINAVIGPEQLGFYSSAFTLVEYGQGIVTTALVASAIPVFLRLHSEQGVEQAQQFIETALRYYVWAAVPVVFLIASVGGPLLELLAGERYASGSIVMPWVAAGIGLHGAFEIVAAGFYLSKNTSKLFIIVSVTAIANVLLNYLAIPYFGIMGAAGTTFICYCGCIIASYWGGKRYLKINIPWHSLFVAIVVGGVIYLFHSIYMPENLLAEIAYKSLTGIALYIVLLASFDSRARKFLQSLLRHRLND